MMQTPHAFTDLRFASFKTMNYPTKTMTMTMTMMTTTTTMTMTMMMMMIMMHFITHSLLQFIMHSLYKHFNF